MKHIRLLAIFTAFMLFAACGGDDGDDDTGAPEDEGTSNTAGGDTSTPGDVERSEDEWETVVAAAEEEGAVIMYSLEPVDTLEQLKVAFEEEYPDITMTPIRLTSAELIERVEQERAGGGDAGLITSTDPGIMVGLDEGGDLADLTGPSFEEVADTIEEFPLLQRSPNTMVMSAQPYYMIWNTDLVEEPIDDYADILERADEFRGSFGAIGFVGPSLSVFYSALIRGVDGEDPVEQYKETGKISSPFLEELASRVEPRLYESGVPMTQAVAAGESKASFFGVATTLAELQAAGAPIEGVLSETAPTNAVFTSGVTAWAPNPNAALVLANFMLSEAGQEVLAGRGNFAVREDVPGSVGSAEGMYLPPDEVLDAEYVAVLQSYFQEVMG